MGGRKNRGVADALAPGGTARTIELDTRLLSDDEWEQLAARVLAGTGVNDKQRFVSCARQHRVQHLRLRDEAMALLEVLREFPAARKDPIVVHQARRLVRLLRDGTAE